MKTLAREYPHAMPTARKASTAALIALMGLSLGACKHGDESAGHVAGWTLIDANQRHPIIVSDQPVRASIRVSRDGHGLSPQQRAQVIDFLDRYRGSGQAGRLIVSVPSGAPNEVAAMQGLAEIRRIAQDSGLAETALSVEPYHTESDHAPPIRLSYSRMQAEGPQCGNWSANIARSNENLAYPNFGCAQQRNLAAMIANPADLLGPRAMDPRPGEQRERVWEKYRKGESTGAQKSSDEKISTKGGE